MKFSKIIDGLSIGAFFGFVTGFILLYEQLQASYAFITLNRYIHYGMFRLIALTLKLPLYKWFIVTLIISILFSGVYMICLLFFSKSRAKESLFNLWGIKYMRAVAIFLVLLLTALNLSIDIDTIMCRPKGPNILMITVDTLRADHLKCYGYHRETSPEIDKLAKHSLMFAECISHITVTTPSFASILTSKRPISHGVLDNFYQGYFLDNRHITMAELLKNEGYATAAFIGGYNMKQKTNLSQGFDLYNDNFRKERNAALVNEEVFPWLEKHKDKKFFLLIHYYDPHGKYDPPAPYNHSFSFTRNECDTSKIPGYQRKNGITDPSFYIAQYDGEIAFTDYHIGRILGKISELGIQSDTLIIFTSDHGETMAEHDWWFDHGCFVFEEQVHVPLLLYYPKMFRVKRVETAVSHIDILPTVLNILDIGFSKDVEGRSLLPLVRGGVWQDEIMFCESGRGDPKRNKNILQGIKGKQFAVRSKEWKLIRTNKTTGINYQLYDLAHDPEELNDLHGQIPTIERELEARLTAFLQEYENSPYYTGGTKRRPNQVLDKEAKGILKSLGYIQ